jgi:hypothetical protein
MKEEGNMKTWMMCAVAGMSLSFAAAAVAAVAGPEADTMAAAWGKDAGVTKAKDGGVAMGKKDAGVSLGAKDAGGGWITMGKDGGGWIEMAKDGGKIEVDPLIAQ